VANPSRRGQVTGPVSGQMRGDEDTPFSNTRQQLLQFFFSFVIGLPNSFQIGFVIKIF
jgi:hypothetical protein